MNNVVLSGRLTKNAEVRYGGEDGSVAIARFTLAVQDYKGTDFINIRALGKQAEWVEKWTSKGTSFFEDEIAVAESSPSKKAEFLTKYCNIKQNSSIAWLDYAVVDGASVEKTLEDFRDCYAVGGIDLSQTTDLTAASVVIEKDGILYAFTQFFMPKNRMEKLQATDGVPYDIFVKKGILTLSGDNYVDYKDVFNWYKMLLEDYGIRPLGIGYGRTAELHRKRL